MYVGIPRCVTPDLSPQWLVYITMQVDRSRYLIL